MIRKFNPTVGFHFPLAASEPHPTPKAFYVSQVSRLHQIENIFSKKYKTPKTLTYFG
jgi:hypothetical protein